MSTILPCALPRIVLGLLLTTVFANAQNSEDGQGSGSAGSGVNPGDAGAAGPQSSGFTMSKSGFIALIVVVVVVAVIGSKSYLSLPLG